MPDDVVTASNKGVVEECNVIAMKRGNVVSYNNSVASCDSVIALRDNDIERHNNSVVGNSNGVILGGQFVAER